MSKEIKIMLPPRRFVPGTSQKVTISLPPKDEEMEVNLDISDENDNIFQSEKYNVLPEIDEIDVLLDSKYIKKPQKIKLVVKSKTSKEEYRKEEDVKLGE